MFKNGKKVEDVLSLSLFTLNRPIFFSFVMEVIKANCLFYFSKKSMTDPGS